MEPKILRGQEKITKLDSFSINVNHSSPTMNNHRTEAINQLTTLINFICQLLNDHDILLECIEGFRQLKQSNASSIARSNQLKTNQ